MNFYNRSFLSTTGSSPKRPSRTKNPMESEFRYGEKIRYGRSKTLRYGEGSEMLVFIGEQDRKTVEINNCEKLQR